MRRFTLVEMMIVVAILMILAAIAIPKLNQMPLAAKRAELLPNLDGVRTAQVAFFTANDVYSVTSDQSTCYPSPPPTKKLRPWPAGAAPEFDLMGWKPDGDVRGVYAALDATLGDNITVCGEMGGCGSGFCIRAKTDVDGDGTFAEAWTSDLKEPELLTVDPY